ncbi:hypothetical protein D3C73_856080 [compost metagenome]
MFLEQRIKFTVVKTVYPNFAWSWDQGPEFLQIIPVVGPTTHQNRDAMVPLVIESRLNEVCPIFFLPVLI